ncbi:hypothetical protein [Kineosporia babensis]|uniref:Secreted protein n=1 Tax=Kineosporia babensis TaxID=499548 RepID=A0A9X1SY99_9ACTN|nr:hypothetical protein [Kineosporia babensis]MCD5316871.1 hypothetical protein [Kineosporia babensis]
MIRRTSLATVPLLAVAALLASCSSNTQNTPLDPATSSAATATAQPPTSSLPATSENGPAGTDQAWNGADDVVHAGTAPAFPEDLAGWSLEQEWTETPRAFEDQWSSLCGPNRCSGYPATMNGCGTHRFLFRWRSLGLPVVSSSSWASTSDLDTTDSQPLLNTELGQTPAATSGWAELNGCSQLTFTLPTQPEGQSTLVDVAVSIQEWIPAP